MKEVNPKVMESRRVNGLYMVGEVLDINGDTAGYNCKPHFPQACVLPGDNEKVRMNPSF